VPASAVLGAGALAAGAEFAAVVFTALGHALAGFNLAIAFGVRAIFFGHGCYLLKRNSHVKEAVIVPSRQHNQAVGLLQRREESWNLQLTGVFFSEQRQYRVSSFPP
jgi:hypothetical protein